MADLIISDHEYLFAEQVLLTYSQNLSGAARQMKTIIDDVMQWGIRASYIDAYLAQLGATVEGLATQLEEVTDSLQGKADAFIHKVDEADDFVY
jgi:hypothetical protein